MVSMHDATTVVVVTQDVAGAPDVVGEGFTASEWVEEEGWLSGHEATPSLHR